MSMRWDPLLAAATARELDARLRKSRVQALLLDAESRRVTLHLREHTLVAELHPLRGWISLLPAVAPSSEARRLPVTIRGVEALPDESAIVFSLPRVRGKDEGLELVLEMIGNRWNAVALAHRSRVIRHVLLPRESRTRTLAVGSPYVPPQSTGRTGPDGSLSPDEWAAVVAGTDDQSDDRRKAILRGIAWTSSLNVDSLLGPDGRERWSQMVTPSGWGGFVLRTGRGPQPYPVRPDALQGDECSSLLEAFRIARERDEETAPAAALLLPPGLSGRLETRLDRARGRVRGLTRELDRTRDPEPVRALGDLILARYGEIPKGADSVTLDGFAGEPVEVELDPALAPDENAARYYDEAARMERAREELPGRIREAERDVERWETLLDRVHRGTADPDTLREELGPVTTSDERGRAGGSAEKLPYRRFRSSGGLEIRVGRGARSNDDLTFHHSAPDDIWLHTRQAPGAHVVLRWNRDDNPPKRDLAEAASLAALHSQARHSGSVPVGWTRRKYVRKPRKAPAGSVTPDRMETVFVRPEPELLDRLAADED